VTDQDSQKRVDAWMASIEAHAAKTRALSERVASLSAKATSADGAVEVTVTSSGVISDLRLDDHVRKWPADRISAEVLSVMREAQRTLAARVAEITEETVGRRSQTGQVVLDEYRPFQVAHGTR
jgi:DNA-binding protein YbaB